MSECSLRGTGASLVPSFPPAWPAVDPCILRWGAGTHLDLGFGVPCGDTPGAAGGARAGPLLLAQQLGASAEGVPHLPLVHQVLGPLEQRGALAPGPQWLSLLLHLDLFGEGGQVMLLFPLLVYSVISFEMVLSAAMV